MKACQFAMSHPYRTNPTPVAKPRVEDWHAALRGPSIRHSLWMGLGTLTCAFGYPFSLALLVRQAWEAHEPFIFGGSVVACYFLFAAIVTWLHRFRFGAIKNVWHARRDSNPRPVD